MTTLGHILKSRNITLPTEVHLSQSYGFSCGHVWMWELDCEESWALKNWCFWTMVLEKTLESPLDCKEIKPVNPKWNQPWIFIGRTDAEAESPILWPHHRKADSLEKTLKLGRLKAGGEGDNRGWDSSMASPTQRILVWASSGRWWRTGKPGMLQYMGSKRIRDDWVTEQSQQHHISRIKHKTHIILIDMEKHLINSNTPVTVWITTKYGKLLKW